MSFIGAVNVLPSYAHLSQVGGFDRDRTQQVFIRPHDLEIVPPSADRSVAATVRRVVHLGWEIQAELVSFDGLTFEVHLSRDQFDDLNLVPDQQVWVKPKTVKRFAWHYDI
jgi:sulfate transport system ATP-binding protein